MTAREPARAERCNILIVEDDGLVARAVARWLRSQDYAVTVVRTGSSALLAGGPFAAMIFDIELPDGNGVDFAQRARRSGRQEPIIFFSACRDPAMLRRADAIGTLVDKGSPLEELGRALEKLVGGGDRSQVSGTRRTRARRDSARPRPGR